MTTDTIAVGFDGSDESVRALRWAVDTARRDHSRLRVVVVALEDKLLAPVLREYEAAFASSAAALARDILHHEHGVEGDVVVSEGMIVPVLLSECRNAKALVVGSRGHGFIESQWLGSVSQHLVTHAPCPVVVVRAPHSAAASQVLVGLDASPGSTAALRYAVERAALTGAEVLAVHAYQFPAFFSGGGLGVPQHVDMTVTDSAERMAAELVAGAREDFPDVAIRSTAVLGRAGEVLTRLSDQAALLVVGSHGRNGFEQLLLGSVAHEVVHRAACPVAVIR